MEHQYDLSFTLSKANFEAVKAAMLIVNSRLPFLAKLSEEQREQLLGDTDLKNLELVDKCTNAVETNPELVPAGFDTLNFKTKLELLNSLLKLQSLFGELNDKLNDSILILNHETLSNAQNLLKNLQSETPKDGESDK